MIRNRLFDPPEPFYQKDFLKDLDWFPDWQLKVENLLIKNIPRKSSGLD